MMPLESPSGAEEIRQKFKRFSLHNFPDDSKELNSTQQAPHTEESAYVTPQEAYGHDRKVGMDPEIRRLEDRIDAVNREGQLRLDAAMARIDGKFDTMMTSMQHMDQSMSQAAERISGMKSIIIGTAIATVIAIVGAVFAGQALWASGFSSGQTDRPAVASAPNTPTH